MFYFIIILIFLLIVFGLFWISDKISKTILSIYLIWWGIWLIISRFNVYELFPVSDSTYLLLLLNVVMFYLGFLVHGLSKSKRLNSYLVSVDDKFFKRSLFTLLLFITNVTLLYYWLRYKSVTQSMDPVNARLQRFSTGGVFSSGTEVLFFNYVIESFMYIVVILLAYMIVYGKIKNITFILSIFCVFLYGGIGSGRGILMDLIIAIGLIFLIRKIEHNHNGNNINNVFNNKMMTKKVKAWTVLIILVTTIIAFIYSAWLTAVRLKYSEFSIEAIQFGMNVFLKQCVVYYTGPFRALEFGLKAYPQIVLFGRGTFAGIDEMLNLILRTFGINYQTANEVIGNSLQNNIIQVGQNQSFNFAYTSLMIHYFDFGIFGITIFPFFYGFFVRKAIFLYDRKPVLPNLIIVAFLFNTMINTIFKWGLQSPSSNIALIGLYIWYKIRYKKLAVKQD